MEFKDKLRKYANLLVVHGLNVQKNQIVNITAEVIHKDFVLIIAEEAYKVGAKFVNVELVDSRHIVARIQNSSEENLKFVLRSFVEKYNELLDEGAANLSIIGQEQPDLLEKLNPKSINTVMLNRRLAIKRYYDEGIGKSKVQWTIAAAATPKWGAKLFPEVSSSQACSLLWEEIFKICRISKSNHLEAWAKHNKQIQERAIYLNKLGISEISFIGPGTDLKVGLSSKAIFKAGSETGPKGIQFEPNIPTEEVFTTPDYRRTKGKVKTTRPFFINGKLIKGLVLEFEKGQIVRFKADDGEETFREYINCDPGAKRLGEVALVGIDSPVYKSKLIFQEILFDENATCHIAIGSGFRFCIRGSQSMSMGELDKLGYNDSNVHTDMMISSSKVDVIAKLTDGRSITLLKNGRWV